MNCKHDQLTIYFNHCVYGHDSDVDYHTNLSCNAVGLRGLGSKKGIRIVWGDLFTFNQRNGSGNKFLVLMLMLSVSEKELQKKKYIFFLMFLKNMFCTMNYFIFKKTLLRS